MPKNIYAYTEPTPQGGYHPGFVSLNEQDDRKIVLTVRSTKAAIPSEIELTTDQLEELMGSIRTYLSESE